MRLIFLAMALVLVSTSASGQSLTGEFAPFNSWWIHPTSGSLGVNHDGTNVNVDQDWDGVPDVAFSNDQVAAEARGNLRLSPTQEYMVGWGGSCGTGGSGSNFYVWSVPPPPGTVLTPTVSGVCIDRVAGSPLPRFYDTGLCDDLNPGLVCNATNLGVSPKRVLYILADSEIGDQFELWWIDLATGTVARTNNTNFRSTAGFVHVSVSGTLAFVQHDLSVPGETDYTLVELCPTDLGFALNPGGAPLSNQQDILRAETTSVSGGEVIVTVFGPPPPDPNPVFTFNPIPDCCAPAGPTGACCRADRTCDPDVEQTACSDPEDQFLQDQDCSACVFPPLTEACCFIDGRVCSDVGAAECVAGNGTPSGPESVCATTMCPSVDLAIDMLGPAAVDEGGLATYTLDYRNDGELASGNLSLQLQAPANTTVESATGDPMFAGSSLIWSFPPLGAMESGSVSFTVKVDCGISMIQLMNVAVLLIDDQFSFAQPAASVDTIVNPIASGPVNIAVASSPGAGPPVPRDVLITHTIELDNTIAQDQIDVFVTDAGTPPPAGFEIGEGVSFEAVVDAAGGAFDVEGSRVGWSGTLPPGTTTISFTTRVLTCLPPGVEANQLNGGGDLAVRSTCDSVLGTAMASAALPLERPLLANLEAPDLKPKARITAPASSYDAQLARPGDRVAVQLRLSSGTGEPVPGAAVSLALLDFGATALVEPTDPAAAFDPNTGTVAWDGTVPATGEVVVTFESDLVACRGSVELSGGSTPGCQDLRDRFVVASVPEPPIDGYLVALGYGQPPSGFAESQVLHLDPAVDTAFSTQLCLPIEFLTGIGVGPQGDVWVGWLPTFHYDPSTLEIEGFDWTRLAPAGISNLSDIAVDPRNGDVYFVGSESVPPFSTRGSIAHYVPRTDAITQVVQDDTQQGYDRGVVDGLGNLVVRSQSGDLVQVDRSDWSLQVLDTGESLAAKDVDVDASDDFVALLGGFRPPFPVVELDSGGADAPIVVDANLGTTFPEGSAFGWGAIAVDLANDDVFVAPEHPGLGVIHRDASGTSTGADVVVAFNQFGTFARADDLHWTMIPEPALRLLQAVSLLCVVAISRRFRTRT